MDPDRPGRSDATGPIGPPRIRCGAVRTDPVRERWLAGEPAFAAWTLLADPGGLEILGTSGFDAVVVDLQHGSATLDVLPHLARAIDATPTVAFVRTARNEPAELMRVLDLGIPGVVCPMVSAREEAEAFVGACRYPPAGIRSYGPIRGTRRNVPDDVAAANDDVSLLAMIETAEALDDVERIAATPGLDGLFVGPTDLGLSLGLARPGDLTDPELLEHVETVERAAAAAGLVAGIHAPDPSRAAEMAARGFRLVSCAVDTDLLRGGAEAALRTARGSG